MVANRDEASIKVVPFVQEEFFLTLFKDLRQTGGLICFFYYNIPFVSSTVFHFHVVTMTIT